MDSDINDDGWGCGWRCIQMLLSQFGIEKDIFTIAIETSQLLGEEISIDFDNRKIVMADTSWIMLYVCHCLHQLELSSTEFNMYHLATKYMLPELLQTLTSHFRSETTLVTVTAGGATSLIAGVRPSLTNSDTFDVYLVDPHMPKHGDFDTLRGFGKGGRGWIDIKKIIYKGKEEIGILDDNEFLLNSSCLFGFIIPKN